MSNPRIGRSSSNFHQRSSLPRRGSLRPLDHSLVTRERQIQQCSPSTPAPPEPDCNPFSTRATDLTDKQSKTGPPSLPPDPRLAVCTLAGMLAFCICRSPNFHTTVFQCGLASPLSCTSPRTPGCGTTSSASASKQRERLCHLMKKNPIHRHPLRPNQPTLSTPSPCSSGRPRENSIRLLSAFSITWVFLECDE